MTAPAVALDPDWMTGDRLPPSVLSTPGLSQVLAALDGAALLVGGVVRNAMLGAPVADIDLATPVPPSTVATMIEAAGLKAVPTGIEHGTVTAVAEKTGFEITTFRADVATDGRRATVRYTEDVAEDASRRDFTINAFYADAEGRVIDPLGGRGDLAERRIRFIGDPAARIREDYLRILRFFRFTAWYGPPAAEPDTPGIDAEGLAAAAELAEGIDQLARERIGHEIRRLLAAPDPAPAVAAMAASGVLMRCLPGAMPAALAPLVHLEGEAGRSHDWLVRLAAIAGGIAAPDLVEALRLSRPETRRLEAILAARDAPAGVAAYRHGAAAAWAGMLLTAASQAMADRPPDLAGAATDIDKGAAARFPLTAGDLMKAGATPGPDLGAALATLEVSWIDSGFTLDKSALLTQFRASHLPS
ncbi:MAG: CCA tRNA nucleotidyltransferase [Pseudomonadota bacterium]